MYDYLDAETAHYLKGQTRAGLIGMARAEQADAAWYYAAGANIYGAAHYQDAAAQHSALAREIVAELMRRGPSLWEIEFPDFPRGDMPTIPASLADVSWRNDVCPSFAHAAEDGAEIRLMVDYRDPPMRERPESPRFSVSMTLDTDDYSAAVALVAAFIKARAS